MSFVDLSNQSPKSIVSHFILHTKGSGHQLPYADYAIIDEWLQIEPDHERLILILSEMLPPFFEKYSNQNSYLKWIDKKVKKQIVGRLAQGRQQII